MNLRRLTLVWAIALIALAFPHVMGVLYADGSPCEFMEAANGGITVCR